MYKDLLLKSPAFLQLQGDIDAGKLSHCYVVCGADENMLMQLVALAAKYFMCRSLCGKCENCIKMESGNHTSYILLRESKIDVEMIKDFIYSSTLTTTDDTDKFFVISNAANINQIAQNKLLKTLEEAPPSTHYFLCTTSLDMLLPTVRSRGIKLYVPALSQEEIRGYLGDNDYADLCAVYSGGSVSRALEIANDAKKLSAMEYIDKLPSKLRTSRDVLSISHELDKIGNTGLVLDMLEIKYHTMIAAPDHGYSLVALGYAIDAVIHAKRMLLSNCNRVSLIERMLMSILEMRKKHAPEKYLQA